MQAHPYIILQSPTCWHAITRGLPHTSACRRAARSMWRESSSPPLCRRTSCSPHISSISCGVNSFISSSPSFHRSIYTSICLSVAKQIYIFFLLLVLYFALNCHCCSILLPSPHLNWSHPALANQRTTSPPWCRASTRCVALSGSLSA